MRFLHTADWHIGKSLRGRSRMAEHEQALNEVLDIARRESIDALLVAGDIFDSQIPNADPERLVYQFLADLAGHGIPAILIAGNHDHPGRFKALQPLLERMRIHIRPHVKPADEGGIFDFTARNEQARIALLPWVPEHKLLDAELLMGTQVERSRTYAERMTTMLQLLTASFSADTINLVLGHVHVAGAEACGSERAIHLAKPYALTAQDFPPTASYIALGHLHRPQQVEAPSPLRYCGSMLQLDFGEQGQPKEVVLIDAHPGKTARMESIRLAAGKQLRDVKGALADLEKRADELNNGDFLRVTVSMPKFKPGIADTIRDLLPETVDVRLEVEQGPETLPEPLPTAATPVELFRRFCRERDGEPADEWISAFEKLYAETSDAAC